MTNLNYISSNNNNSSSRRYSDSWLLSSQLRENSLLTIKEKNEYSSSDDQNDNKDYRYAKSKQRTVDSSYNTDNDSDLDDAVNSEPDYVAINDSDSDVVNNDESDYETNNDSDSANNEESDRFRSSKANNESSTNDTVSHKNDYKPDIMAICTYYMYSMANIVYDLFERFRSSVAYRFLFHTAAPAHAILIIAITLVTALFFPFDPKAPCSSSNAIIVTREQRRPVTCKSTYLIYLTALSLHVGSQFWMTFVSGLSLYFNLARHAFGDVQKILFPRYFTLNCILSAIILIQFGRLHERQIFDYEFQTILQVIALSFCFLLELLIRLYLVPSLLELISAKTVMEKSAGIGQEVGRYDPGRLSKCPHYMSIHKSFRKVHMCTAIGNIISMMCSAFHLCYLANKWTHHLAI